MLFAGNVGPNKEGATDESGHPDRSLSNEASR